VNHEELFEKHLRGELAPEDAAELKRVLANEPGAGRAFVEYANETALLVRVGSQLQSAWPAENVVPLPSLPGATAHAPDHRDNQSSPDRAARSSRFVKWAAWAACLAAAGIIFGLFNRDASPGRVSEVRVPEVYVSGEGVRVTRGGVLLKGDDVGLMAGDVITAPTNRTATIVYEHESTRVVLQPGTVLVFGGATQGKQFELRRGTIEARVAPQPAGLPMSVQTAHALATVVGTEFVMRADERATKLDVLEGKVQLACRATGKTVKVKAGFAATLNRKAPFNLAPLCKTNCILRECRDTNAIFKSLKQRKTE
jgi:hypothetical protein